MYQSSDEQNNDDNTGSKSDATRSVNINDDEKIMEPSDKTTKKSDDEDLNNSTLTNQKGHSYMTQIKKTPQHDKIYE